MMQVAALFVRTDSIYKMMDGVDAYDARRDARRWRGGCPAVMHPPCRAWGCLKHFAKPSPGERWLAIWAVIQVRRNGGVIEHPKGSSLWKRMNLPKPGEPSDQWGGLTIELDQFHFGHKARKRTWLYIVGAPGLPSMPLRRGEASHVIARSGRTHKQERPNSAAKKPWCSHYDREATPPQFAKWLVALAATCKPVLDASPTQAKS